MVIFIVFVVLHSQTGQTALMVASFRGHLPIVERLLAAGAKTDLQKVLPIWLRWEVVQPKMKGTEVPNPRRSSACDYTCVIRNRTLSHDSCLPCAFCFVPAYAKFAHEFLTLFHRPCATYLLAFLADFTLSDSSAPIHFVVELFSLANYTLLFVWIERQAMITAFTCFPSYRYSSFTLAIPLLEAYCQWPFSELAKSISPRTKWPLAT